jgi:inorganic pyrophosphatase
MLTVLHPWHGAPGDQAPRIANAVINSKGEKAKYEITNHHIPGWTSYCSPSLSVNYGFIPQSLGDDKDTGYSRSFQHQRASPLPGGSKGNGVMQMIDGDADDKIIAVAQTDLL